MNATSYLIVLLQTTICLSAALLICAVARKSSSVRLLVSQIAIVICAVFMVAGSWIQVRYLPMVTVKVPEPLKVSKPISKPIQPTEFTTPLKDDAKRPVPISIQAAPSMNQEPIVASTPISLGVMVTRVYGIGLTVSLLPFLFGAFWIRKTRRKSARITEGQTFDVLCRVTLRHGVKVPALYSSSNVTIPFVTGIFRKQVFVPVNWINEQCDIACSAVIEHEVAHIVSRDLEWKFLCRVACALVWFQPLTWVMFRVMSNASEELCDQSVLAAGVSKTAYANTLLEIREKAKKANVPGLVIGAVSRESNLAKRMKLILATDPKGIRRASRLVLWFAVCCFAFSVATSTFVFGQRERSELSPFAARSAVGAIALLDHLGQPVKGALAWLIVVPNTEGLPELRPLQVIGNQAMVTERSIDRTRMGLLVVKNREGQIDYKRIWPSQEKIAQFNLAKPSTIRGQIPMPSGLKPFPAIRAVMIRVKDEGFTGILPLFLFKEIAPSATLSEDGHFEMKGLPAESNVVLEVDDDRIAQDRQKMEVKIDDKGKSTFLRLQAHYGGTISGRVLRDGKPVAGIIIAAQGQSKSGWGQSVSDANGMYRISRLDPDKYNIAAVLDRIQRKDFTAYATEGVLMKYGDVKEGIKLTLIRGGTILGVLLDTKGKPVSGAPIGVFGEAHPGSSAMVVSETTDAQGHFEARVPPGDNQVYYMGPNGMGKPVLVHVTDGMESKITLKAPFKIEPKVLDAADLVREPAKVNSYGPVTLPDRSSISLMYLCQGQSPSTVVVWQPDGTIDRSPKNIQDLEAVNYFNEMTEGYIWARIHVEDPLHKASDYQMKGDGMLNPGMWFFTPYGGKNQSDILLQMLPGKPSIGSISIQVPYGEYSTLYKGEPNQKAYRMVEPIKNSQTLQVMLPNNSMDHEISVIAKDALGQTSEGSLSRTDQGVDKSFVTTYTFGFDKKILTNTIEVRSRSAQWVTFKDFHLQPTKK